MANHPFEIFNLNPNLIDAVKDLNFNKPTEIQNRIIPRIKKAPKNFSFNREAINHFRIYF